MPATPACPRCAKENTYPDGENFVCADCGHDWPAVAPVRADDDADKFIKDSNGTVLANGDAVVLIKDLKVKGSSITLKVGTIVFTGRGSGLLGEVDIQVIKTQCGPLVAFRILFYSQLRCEFQLGLKSGARCQPHQQVHAKPVDFASLQIRHARLGNSQHLGGLGLRHAGLFQPTLQSNQQLRAHFHLGRFLRREKIVKDTPPRRRHMPGTVLTFRNLFISHNFTLQST